MKVFDLFGEMSLKGMDKVTGELDKVKSRTEQVQKGMKIMGAAFTAVGAAGLALVASSKKINAQLGVTALNLGVTTKEMRELTLATTNVTFPIAEVTASFDLLARAGVKDTEVLKSVATAFDSLGDATGQSASQVTAMMIPAMKTFGLTAEEMAKKTDMMTYMSRESTMTMADFNTMVGYTTPELVKAGLSMEDLTAALIYMERQGYAPGRVMTREFMKATTLATKEQIPLTEALGMTSEELAGYKEELAGATGMTDEFAEAANKQYTIMDKLRHKWSELTLQYGTFLQPLEPILATMTALGPVLLLFSTVLIPRLTFGAAALRIKLIALAAAHKIAAAATWLWNIALAANPIGIVIVAIGALIAAGIALWKNWDKVVTFFTGGVKEMEQSVSDLELKVRDASEDMIADVSKATQAAINNASEIADIERQKLNERAGFYRDFQYERMRLLDEQMIAEIRAVDPVLAAELEGFNKEMVALDDREKKREEAAEKDRIRALKKDLEAEDLTKSERRRIERELEEIEDANKREEFLAERNEKIKGALLDEHFENAAAKLDEQLAAQIAGYTAQEKALKDSLGEKEALITEHVDWVIAEYQRITKEGDIEEPAFTMPGILPPAPAPAPPKKKWWQFAGGGLIPEPTLLYGLRSKRPYGIAGEAGMESIVPGGGVGGRSLVINVYVSGSVVTERDLVSSIRETLLETQSSNVNLGFKGI